MNDLLRLLPPIRRARGNRLYAADGTRFLDLWLDDGRGILGERDRAARTQAANAADKGLTRPYPGLYDARFAKAVAAAWPGFGTVRTFSSEERAMEAAARALGAAPAVPRALLDSAQRPSAHPAAGTAGGEPGSAPTSATSGAATGIALARPFAAIPETCDIAMPRLPCPRPFAPACLMARRGTRAEAALAAEPGDLVPAQSLFAAARGLASLESAVRDGYAEDLWARFDKRLGAWFERSGPYVFAVVADAGYAAFWKAALAGGALLSPRPDAPSTIPPDFDDGELVKLAKALSALGGR